MDKEFEDRLVEYRKEVRDIWLKWVPAMALIFAPIAFGMGWLFTHGGGQPADPDWWMRAALLYVVVMIPPIYMLYPERPTVESVQHDRVLNEIGQRLLARRNGE